MMDSFLRPLKDRLLSPLVFLVSRFATPNGLSLTAFFAGIACAAAILTAKPVLAFGLWTVNRIIDGLYGALARAAGKTSDAGGYLDIMLDFMVYAALPLAMIFRSPDLALTRAGTVLLAAFYLNAASWMYLAALLEKRGTGDLAAGDEGSATSGTTVDAARSEGAGSVNASSTGKDGGLTGIREGGDKARQGNTNRVRRTSTVMPAGIFAGTETIIFYNLMILLPPWRAHLFWMCGVLTLAGALLRFFWELKVLRKY